MQHPARHFLDAAASDAFARLEQAAHEAATSPWNKRKDPSTAQKRVGNYFRGRFDLRPGLPVTIDNARGTFRTGTSPDGTAWQNRMAAHYGDITGTKGADGDAVDIFLGPFPESPRVWVINQRRTWGDRGFDEHKVMAGFLTEEQARAAYLGSYDRGWDGLESIVPCTFPQLKWWLRYGDCTARFTTENLPYEGSAAMDATVLWDKDANPVGLPMHQLLYDLRRADAGASLLLDSVEMADLMGDPDIEGLVTLDALVVEVSRMSIKMELLKKVMEAAGEKVKPTDVTISDPVRARGVLQVMVLFQMSDGQTIAIWFHNPDTTPAKLTPLDELISWKWMLNKRDVTIVVAPERGKELNIREVARRVMRLVERNSDAFRKANAKASERVALIAGLKSEVAVLEVELSDVQRKVERARMERDEAPTPKERWDSARGFAKHVYSELRAEVAKVGLADRRVAAADGYGNAVEVLGLVEGFASGTMAAETPEGLRSIVESHALEVRAHLAQATVPAQAAPAVAADAPADAGSSDSVLSGLGVSLEDVSGMQEDGGYAAIVADEKLSLKWQDTLDAAMQQRLVDVRNALRGLGWVGTGTSLSKTIDGSVYGITHEASTVGAGANMVALTWVLNTHEGVPDGLTEKAPAFAAALDARVSQSVREAVASIVDPAPAPAAEAPGYHWRIFADGDGANGRGAKARYGSLAMAKDALDTMDNGAGNFYGVDEKTRDVFWSFKAETAIMRATGRTPEPEQEARLLDDARRWANKEREEYGWAWMVRNLPKWIVLRTGILLSIAEALVRKWAGPEYGGPAGSEGAPSDGEVPGRISGMPATAAQIGLNVAPELMGTLPAGFTEGANGIAANSDPMSGGIIDSNIASGKWFVVFNREGIPSTGDVFDTRAEAITHFEKTIAEAGEAEPAQVPAKAPTDAELEAAAEAGAEVRKISRNLADPKGTAGLPRATLSTEDGKTTIFLYTESDVTRAVKAVHDAEDMTHYKAFDPSTLKMPTAAQLGLNKQYTPVLIVSDTDNKVVLDGWSNGHVLDLVGRPAVIQKALDKYVGDLATSGFARRVPMAKVERLETAAKGRAVQVRPIAHYDFEEVDNKAKPNQRIPRNSLVLESADGKTWVWLDERYVAYFWKTYKGCEFFGEGPDASVAVRHHGKLVGIVMPRAARGDASILLRAKRAQAKAQAAASPDELSAAAVDAAYQFAEASDAFKIAVAHSVKETSYSPFLSARSIDERAKALGLSVAWDVQAVVLDSVPLPTFSEEDAKPLFVLRRERVLDALVAAVKPLLPTGTVLDFAGDVGAAIAQLEIALDVVITNEPINRAAGNVEQADLEARNAAQFRNAIHVLSAGSKVLDDADGGGEMWETVVGTITHAGEVIGRAVVADGDGKCMVYVGATGTQRVTFVSPVDGERRKAMWSDDDAGEMVDWLVENLAHASKAAEDAIAAAAAAPAEPAAEPVAPVASGGGEPPADPPAAPPAAVEPEPPRRATEAEGRAALKNLHGFIGRSQRLAILSGMDGEEGQYFFDLMVDMERHIAAMPKTYEQDGKGGQAVAHLHYFRGSGDWWITERDMEAEQHQAFGLADLGHGGELGYISIVELIRNGVELDLHWTPKTIDEIRGTKEPATEDDEDSNIGRSWRSPEGAMEIIGYDKQTRRYKTQVNEEEVGPQIEPDDVDRYVRDDERRAAEVEEEFARIAVEQRAREEEGNTGVPELEAAGYTRVGPGVEYVRAFAQDGSGSKRRYNIRQFGEVGGSKQYRVTMTVSFAHGFTGAGQDVGVYDTPAQALAAVHAELDMSTDKWLPEAPARRDKAPLPAASPKGDISYSEVDDMFTSFFPDSQAGEEAWALINAAPESSGGKVLTMHAAGVIQQLRAAGYTVTKSTESKMSDDELAAALAEPAAAALAPSAGAADDIAYLQSLIDGTADMLDAGIFDRIEPMFAKYERNAEMTDLLTRAANAYSDAAAAAAKSALAG